MVPLYAARIEDLGPGDFVKVDCTACDHTALLSPAFLFRLGLEPLPRVVSFCVIVRMSVVCAKPQSPLTKRAARETQR